MQSFVEYLVLSPESNSVERLAESDLLFKKIDMAAEWKIGLRALKGLGKHQVKDTHQGERRWWLDQSSSRIGGEK